MASIRECHWRWWKVVSYSLEKRVRRMWATRKRKGQGGVRRALVTSVTDAIRHAVPCSLGGMCSEPEAAGWALREGRACSLLSLLQGRSEHSLASEDEQLLDTSGSLSLGQRCLLKLASCQFLTTWRGAVFGCNPSCSKKAEQEKLFFKVKEMTTGSYVNENDPGERENLMRRGRIVCVKSVVTQAWGWDMAPNIVLT